MRSIFKFYIKRDKDGFIRDVITYPHKGFEEILYDDHVLPRGILEGYYKWNGQSFIVDEVERKKIKKEEAGYLGYLEDENVMLKLALADLAESIVEEKFKTQIALAELAEITLSKGDL